MNRHDAISLLFGLTPPDSDEGLEEATQILTPPVLEDEDAENLEQDTLDQWKFFLEDPDVFLATMEENDLRIPYQRRLLSSIQDKDGASEPEPVTRRRSSIPIVPMSGSADDEDADLSDLSFGDSSGDEGESEEDMDDEEASPPAPARREPPKPPSRDLPSRTIRVIQSEAYQRRRERIYQVAAAIEDGTAPDLEDAKRALRSQLNSIRASGGRSNVQAANWLNEMVKAIRNGDREGDPEFDYKFVTGERS